MGYGCLSLYIDPSLHPVITKKDPRWLGAWWLGWIILGATMGMFSILIAMFPRNLPAEKNIALDTARKVKQQLILENLLRISGTCVELNEVICLIWTCRRLDQNYIKTILNKNFSRISK